MKHNHILQFGLDYSIDKVVNIVNATGSKMHYYSTYKKAEKMGYKPENTALEGVIIEMKDCCCNSANKSNFDIGA
jgi:hypothetical protein